MINQITWEANHWPPREKLKTTPLVSFLFSCLTVDTTPGIPEGAGQRKRLLTQPSCKPRCLRSLRLSVQTEESIRKEERKNGRERQRAWKTKTKTNCRLKFPKQYLLFCLRKGRCSCMTQVVNALWIRQIWACLKSSLVEPSKLFTSYRNRVGRLWARKHSCKYGHATHHNPVVSKALHGGPCEHSHREEAT